MKRIFIFGIVVLGSLFLFSACRKNNIPQSGVWYNENLQIVLDFSEKSIRCNASVIKDTETVLCFAGYYRDSNVIYVCSQEKIEGICDLGEEMFALKCIKLSDTSLTVVDCKTEQEYIFVRTQ